MGSGNDSESAYSYAPLRADAALTASTRKGNLCPMSASAILFTSQDLAGQAAKVFDAVRRFGSADIRTQEGDVFEMKLKREMNEAVGMDFPDFDARWKRLRELGLVPPPPSENERINRIIAGEE